MILEPLRIAEYAMMFSVLFFTVVMLLIYLRNRERITRSGQKKYEPTVSVVIPAYNEEETVGKTLESLLEVDYPKDKIEILVVDDGSTDKTAAVVRSFKDKRVVLLQKKNEGNKAFANNHGIRHSKGEVIITLDADSWVAKDAIRKLLAYFDTDVAAVTSAVKVREKDDLNFIEKLQRVEYLFTIFNRRLFAMINGVYVTPGPLSAFRRKVFDEVGLFDTNTIMEDQEIALRIQSANYRIESCMDAVVYTSVPRDFDALMKQRIRWNRGGMQNAMKYAFMVNPKYGDFGMFVMTYSIASILLLLLVSTVVAVAMTKIAETAYNDPLLAIEPIHVLSFIVLLLTIGWTVIALREINDKKTKKRIVLAYTILYCYLITLFMFIAIFKELKGEKQVW
ncbi:Glycosyltransferase AglI [uncultured archaeon]|nr:Glycosyltransferase AglI [uncultured archaeon]